MARNRFHISLFILVPVIFTGIVVLIGLVTYRLTVHWLARGGDPVAHLSWFFLGVSAATFLGSMLLMRFILKPVTQFIKEAESLPIFPAPSEQETAKESQDEITHYSQVFTQVTSILNKMEARELFPDIVGESRVMRSVFSQIMRVAPTDSTVLITGESGTGKELVATSVYEHSLRTGKPFVKLNCVAIPVGLLESELFGHEKGSFTGASTQKKGKFELAGGGTIFLDEIGDMPLETQAKILRVLQEREFERVGGTRPITINVRLIAATNKNIQEMVREGKFREDLFYRLNVFPVYLPPLRERREDIPVLAEYFLSKHTPEVKLSSTALQYLIGYSWPGNIRELQNALERAAIIAEDGIIEPAQLPVLMTGEIIGKNYFTAMTAEKSIDDRLSEIEKGIIIEALTRAGGIQAKAAQILGIKQRSLWHRIEKYGIDVQAMKKSP